MTGIKLLKTNNNCINIKAIVQDYHHYILPKYVIFKNQIKTKLELLKKPSIKTTKVKHIFSTIIIIMDI